MSDYETLTAQTLKRYASGEMGWRDACKTLGLFEYDELLQMLSERGLQPPMPTRENGARDTLASLGLPQES